jgi:hypothetical protein
MKYIHLPVFIISLAIGFLFVYLNNPHKKQIYVYPTPDNVDRIQYVDNVNNCYNFNSTEITCPKDKNKITNYKVQ